MTDRTIFSSVTRPARYLGQEFNSSIKSWEDTLVRFGLVFPDLYEIGMSHQGLQILYHIINRRKEFLAERCYCPDLDAEQLLRSRKQPLTTLESGHNLRDFDIIGFTLPYELCYTNILTVLDLTPIPFYAKDRDTTFPLIIGGGACSMNPEPVADFFDAILIGDGEKAIVEIGELIADLKSQSADKSDMLHNLASIEGVYIPAHFIPRYQSDDPLNRLERIDNVIPGNPTVSRRVLANLDDLDHLKTPLVPNAKIIHDRLGIEVARGCTRGCRFCQAGITYRPVRERSAEQVMELARSGIRNSGFEELALLSLSTGDYSCINQTLPALMDEFAHRYISVAMPSMRVGTLTPTIMEEIKRVRKTGFTLAPEAGSERLRQVINKGITEEDLITTCTTAFELGWRIIKCYFMIGLPTETDEDIEAINTLVRKIMKTRNSGQGQSRRQANVSVGTFVPKPHTPFQWEKQLSTEESFKTMKYLQDQLPRKGCNLKYHNPKVSYLEGVFSRGDRRLAKLLERAWQNGARLDGWSEHFNLDIWQTSALECQLELDNYLRARDKDEILPWSHLQSGVETEFLKEEFHRAKKKIYTPDCRYHDCQKCGLCDFKTIMPIVHNRTKKEANRLQAPPASPRSSDINFKYIVEYSRTGNISYLGHLEILQIVFRVLRRADIPTHYSRGFNPSPKVSFGPALPVGTESLAEYFIMTLHSPIDDIATATNNLNETLPPGLTITGIAPHSGKVPQKIKLGYGITFGKELNTEQVQKTEDFLNSSAFPLQKTRKGKTREIDIRPLIQKFQVTSLSTLKLEMISESTQPGIKPIEALTGILGLTPEEAIQVRIIKEWWIPLDDYKLDV